MSGQTLLEAMVATGLMALKNDFAMNDDKLSLSDIWFVGHRCEKARRTELPIRPAKPENVTEFTRRCLLYPRRQS
jgi:hypothetical protein